MDLFEMVSWRPPANVCPRCAAILISHSNTYGDLDYFKQHQSWVDYEGKSFKSTRHNDKWASKCPLCGLIMDMRDKKLLGTEVGKYTNISKLAGLASSLPPYTPVDAVSYSPLAILIELLTSAEKFIHFMTWNIDSTFLTVLHIASKKATVRGIVSRPLDGYSTKLMNGIKDNDRFTIKMASAQGYDAPHTKMIVIDGIVMIEGSSNLTISALDKISGVVNPPGEKLTVVLDPNKVLEDNNRYFSPNWLTFQNRTSDLAEEIFPAF